jgi:glutamine amidotransferase
LDRDGWRGALIDVADVQLRPVLGVCLGMQLLLEKSEEGDLPGLGLVPGHVAHFDFAALEGAPPRIPHMGWNVVTDVRPNELSSGDETERRFYFAHSYHAQDVPDINAIMRAHYGYEFVCGVRRDNVWGVQFHPEKSHKFGMHLLAQFLAV